MSEPILRIFSSGEALGEAVREDFYASARENIKARGRFLIAFAGGNTPRAIHRRLVPRVPDETELWHSIEMFWGDERCVYSEHPESNYRMTRLTLFRHIQVQALTQSIKQSLPHLFPLHLCTHRIKGEGIPVLEADRYERLLKKRAPLNEAGLPVLDWIFLGVGTDGHTASLFPGFLAAEERKRLCVETIYPQTGQRRITMTLPVLNAARRIAFIVAGKEKAQVVHRILDGDRAASPLPAAHVVPTHGTAYWYLDKEAASFLSHHRV